MDRLTETLQKYLVPFGEWMSERKTLNAITNGLRLMFPMIILGAVISIIINPPSGGALLEGTGMFTKFLTGWNTFADAVGPTLMVPYDFSMNALGFITVITVSYSLAKAYDLEPLPSALIAVLVFFMVTAPTTDTVTMTNALAAVKSGDASSLEAASTMSTTFMGSMGMFVGIFIALISVNITKFTRDKNIGFNMGDAIPPYVAQSFESIIPFFLNVIIVYGLNVVVQTVVGASIPELLLFILMPAISAVTSPIMMIFILVLSHLLWSVGIHGGLLNAPLLPIYIAAATANGELVNIGQPGVYEPIFLMTHGYAGGMGSMLALGILMARSKSKQLKAIGKLGSFPAFFGISEPLMFGTPVVLNPLLAIPMVISSLVITILSHFLFVFGILTPPNVPLLSNMPMGMGPFLSTGSILNALYPFVITGIAMLIYYPFVKILDKQKLEEELEGVES